MYLYQHVKLELDNIGRLQMTVILCFFILVPFAVSYGEKFNE